MKKGDSVVFTHLGLYRVIGGGKFEKYWYQVREGMVGIIHGTTTEGLVLIDLGDCVVAADRRYIREKPPPPPQLAIGI